MIKARDLVLLVVLGVASMGVVCTPQETNQSTNYTLDQSVDGVQSIHDYILREPQNSVIAKQYARMGKQAVQEIVCKYCQGDTSKLKDIRKKYPEFEKAEKLFNTKCK